MSSRSVAVCQKTIAGCEDIIRLLKVHLLYKSQELLNDQNPVFVPESTIDKTDRIKLSATVNVSCEYSGNTVPKIFPKRKRGYRA